MCTVRRERENSAVSVAGAGATDTGARMYAHAHLIASREHIQPYSHKHKNHIYTSQ